MSTRDKVPFGDLLLDSKDGEWGEGAPGVGLVAADMIRGTDFAELNSPAKVLPRRYVNEKHAMRKRLQVGDIVFEMAGGTAKQSTGRSALITKAFLNQRGDTTVLCASFCRHLRLDQSKYDPQYVSYVLQALYGAGYMAVFNVQHTGVSRFQYTSFKKHTILEMPSLANQQKIAAILSAYDDLIANNQRRITLLERMAEDIYREWFVRLRFPGHENVKIEKGVPQGWDVLPFTNVVNINPREKINASAQVPFVPMDELSTSQMYFNVNEYRQHAAGSKFRNNDVLFPRITPSLENGKRGYVLTLPNETVGVGSTEFIVLREQTLSSEHIYFLTCSSEFRKHAELSMTGASGRQRVSEDCFGFLLVKVPPDELRNKFKETVGPYFQQIRLLSESLSKLKATRDSLLPRLISGKLSVDALDIRFPPGMADADA
jgi:type I restriction enzyme, S subunit